MTGKYDHTKVNLAQSLGYLSAFLSEYSLYLELHVPPMQSPKRDLLVTAFKLRLSIEDDFDQEPLYILKTPLVKEPKRIRTSSGRISTLGENDILARRWQTHIEHLVTFILESPEGIKSEVMYRTLGGYLATGRGQNLLDLVKPKVIQANADGKLLKDIDIFGPALPAEAGGR